MSNLHWIFGYGSLIWRQDFPFVEERPASIEGWSRRFWQGSHDHRGTETDPGRVVTLIEAPEENCHGAAFLVEHEVFTHLDHREKNGYQRLEVDITFADSSASGLVYIAETDNFAYLGEAPVAEIATHIRRCVGPSGTNVEYVLELAKALRQLGVSDPHVFAIEALLLGKE